MGRSEDTCMQGWGQGRPGAQLPSLVAWQEGSPPGLQREGRGGLSQVGTRPSRAFRLFPVDCTEGSLRAGPGNGHCGSAWVVEHPPFWAPATSFRGCPLPAWGLLAGGWGREVEATPPWPGPAQLGEEARATAVTEGGGAESGGKNPRDLHPNIFTSWSSELSRAAQAGGEGGVPLGRVRVGAKPLQNCAGCFVWGLCSFPRRLGLGGQGRKTVLLHPFFLSVLYLTESVSHVSFCLAAGAQLH